MLRADNRRVACVGNVGVPASDRALCGEHDEWVVVECSSYRAPELPLALDVRAAVLTELQRRIADRTSM